MIPDDAWAPEFVYTVRVRAHDREQADMVIDRHLGQDLEMPFGFDIESTYRSNDKD